MSGNAFFETSVPVNQGFFVCSGSGAWARQSPARYRVFVVQDYGAKGDGVSDDLHAIVVAASAAANSGGIVFFPPGVYVHSDLIDFGSNTLVQGAGDSSVIVSPNYNHSVLRFLNASNCGIAQIRTISAATNRLTTDTSTAILFNGAQSCYANNVTVEGSASVGIMIENSSRIVADSNRIGNTQADGIHVVDGSHDIQVTHNRAFNTGDDSFSAVAYANLPQTKNVTIDSNVSVSSHARGIACVGAANCAISNNKIYNPQGHGIAVAYETVYNTYTPTGAIVEHNVVRGVASPAMNGLLVSFAKNVQVSDLQIYDSSPAYCHGSSQVQLTGVRIYNALGAALLGVGCSQLSLQNIQIAGASGQGVNLQGIQGGSLVNVALANLFTAGATGAAAIEIDGSDNVTGSTNTVSDSNLGSSQSSLLQIYNSTKTSVAVAATQASLPSQPAIDSQGVVGAALNQPLVQTISGNGMLSIFGSRLSGVASVQEAQSSNLVNSYLPQSLSSTCVDVGGVESYLLYLSKGQINAVAPLLAPLGQASVEVVSNCGQPNEIRSNAVTMPVATATPEFFLSEHDAKGPSPVIMVDSQTGVALKTAHPGELITLYLGGLGVLSGSFEPGLVGLHAESLALPIQVSLDGAILPAAAVLYCGATGDAGLYQLNLRLPGTLRSGDLSIRLVTGGAETASNVYLPVAAQ